MRKRFLYILLFLCVYFNCCIAQPNVCILPPDDYKIGGGFDISVLKNGTYVSDSYLCLPEKAAVSTLGVINKSSLETSTIRYIFGVDNSTIIPKSLANIQNRTIDGRFEGEFWVMQIGEENGEKKLNCKKIQVTVSDRPVVTISSCENRKMEIQLNTLSPISYFYINWGDGLIEPKVPYQPQVMLKSHEYKKSPQNKIEIYAVSEKGSFECRSVPIELTPPSVFSISSLELTNGTSSDFANLKINNPKLEELDVLVSLDKGKSYSLVKKTRFEKITIDNLPKQDIYFKLRNNSSQCLSDSPPVYSLYPQLDNSTSGHVDLEWNSIASNSIYKIERYGGTPIEIPQLRLTKFRDTDIECGVLYSYRVIGTYVDLLDESVSVISSVVAIKSKEGNNLKKISKLFASTTQRNEPVLNILEDFPNNLNYSISRSIDGSPFEKIFNTKAKKVLDSGNTSVHRYCYVVEYEDECSVTSPPSNPVCTIFLEADNDKKTLSWNEPVSPLDNFVMYEVRRVEPLEILSEQLEKTFEIENLKKRQDAFEVVAKISLKDIDNLIVESKSNPVFIEHRNNIFVPDAFSPNNDGLNDAFEIKYDDKQVKQLSFKIFNKWGIELFESSDSEKVWNGKYKNNDVLTGEYIVQINYFDNWNNTYQITDIISLLR